MKLKSFAALMMAGVMTVSYTHLSVLSSAFGIVPYIAVAILLQKALASSLTTAWAILLPSIALCGYLLKHALYAKSTLCSHKVAYLSLIHILTMIL